MCASLVASAYNGSTRDRSRGERCVVYDSVADHLDDSGRDLHGIRGNLTDFPSQPRGLWQICLA